MEVKKNELKVNGKSTPITSFTKDKADWKKCVTEVIENSGHRYLWSQQQEEFDKLTFEKGGKCLIVTLFPHGNIEIITKEDVDEFLRSLVPQLEKKLGATITGSFQARSASDSSNTMRRNTIATNSCKRIDIVRNGTVPNQQSVSPSPIEKLRRKDVRKREYLRLKNFILFLTMQHEELFEMKLRLDRSQHKLASLRTEITTLRHQFTQLKSEISQKRVEKERQLFNETFLHDSKVDQVFEEMKENKEMFYRSIREEISNQMQKMKW